VIGVVGSSRHYRRISLAENQPASLLIQTASFKRAWQRRVVEIRPSSKNRQAQDFGGRRPSKRPATKRENARRARASPSFSQDGHQGHQGEGRSFFFPPLVFCCENFIHACCVPFTPSFQKTKHSPSSFSTAFGKAFSGSGWFGLFNLLVKEHWVRRFLLMLCTCASHCWLVRNLSCKMENGNEIWKLTIGEWWAVLVVCE
jgi:hypothetical protein